MKKRNLLWAIPLGMMVTACGGGEESTEAETSTKAEVVEEPSVQYGPFLTTEEVAETDRIESLEDYNTIEDKSTVIRYVSGAYKAPFPTELLEAHNLQVLSINVDGELPTELGDYKNLTTLVLGGNFTTLPESVGELENLKAVSFEYCKDLDVNQALSVLANCPNLQYLNLANMGMAELPANIGEIKNLKSLRLSGNAMASLPDSFYTLANLTHLRLGKNEAMDYNAVLTSGKDLPALENLWLQYCGFETLPAVLGEYPALTKVNWREEWSDLDSDGIIAKTEKESKKFENFDVSWNSMSGMFYDIY